MEIWGDAILKAGGRGRSGIKGGKLVFNRKAIPKIALEEGDPIKLDKKRFHGRLHYAVGDNERATRLSGVRYWQVITALYITSSVLAGITGLLYIGLIKAPSLSLAEPLVLAFGGRSRDRRHLHLQRPRRLHRHRRLDPHRADDTADHSADASYLVRLWKVLSCRS